MISKHKQLERAVTRLRQLQRVLSLVPDEEFSIRYWGCGTSKCLAGHAGSDPWFRRRGFVYGETKKFSNKLGYVTIGGRVAKPQNLARFFGIEEQEARALFFEGARGADDNITADSITYRRNQVKELRDHYLRLYRRDRKHD